jgi:polar amino acid transport system substrate-binding protein
MDMSKLLNIRLFIFYIFALSVLFTVNKSLADTANNKYVYAGCSDWKPYCYKENGQLQGSLVDISKAILNEADIKYTFNVFPWVRVYHKGLNEADFLVLGLGRTPKRESLFKWIAPLKKPAKIHAFQRADSEISLTNTDDLKDYIIVVERASYTHDYLIDRGHDEDKLVTVSRYSQIFKVLLHGRAQLFLLDDGAFKPEVLRSGFDPDLFQRSILAFTVTEYLATSLKTSDEMVEKIQLSYAELMKQGKIDLPD